MNSQSSRQIHFVRGKIVTHQEIAQATWQVEIHSPELAEQFVPGQFAMLKIAGRQDAILGRAFAFWDRTFDRTGRPNGVQFVYLVKGRLTKPLSTMPVGTELEVWGPLGNGFSNASVDHLVLVAGGVGQTPMLAMAQEALGLHSFGSPARFSGYAKKVTLVYGARSEHFLAGLPKFHSVKGLHVRITTEDGSAGRKGRVTDELRDLLASKSAGESVRVCCCGPEPMMEAVGQLAAEFQTPCEVSLETPMACGIGICFTCVARVNQPDGSWDYRRTCIEGPVFDAESICWH